MDRLDQTCRLPLGTRDAVHIPIVVGQLKYEGLKTKTKIQPGDYVQFIDNSFTKFILCEKEEAHGIINPFIDNIYYFDNVIIFLLPGITFQVRHTFDINVEKPKWERECLELELKERKKADPQCAECYEIINNEIIRM